MKKETKKIIHYPNLRTMLEVEQVLKKTNEPMSKEEIKRQLPAKIMHQTLNLIIEYMKERGLVNVQENGVIWIFKTNGKTNGKANGIMKV